MVEPWKIMSFNVRNMRAEDGLDSWELRRTQLCELIRRHRPDVVGTQEGFHEQVAFMRAALPEYDCTGVGRDDGKFEGEHCALFFRRDRFRAAAQGTFWFSDTPDVPGSRHWTPIHARICTWARLVDAENKAIYVYNIHLDYRLQSARQRSADLLLERIRCQETPDPVLVIGDFNVTEENPVIATLKAATPRPLRDTFRLAHPDAVDAATFHGFKGDAAGDKIDYILASPELEVLDAVILRDNEAGRYPSDHFPITAVVI